MAMGTTTAKVDEDAAFVAEMNRHAVVADRVTIGFCVLTFLLLLAFLATGCAAHHAPDLRPAPPARIEAHLDAIPMQVFAGRPVMLDAWLADPEGVVRCPSIEWELPDGTAPTHTSDCDPDEVVTRHSEIRYQRMGLGDNQVGVTFASAGRRWSAHLTVPGH